MVIISVVFITACSNYSNIRDANFELNSKLTMHSLPGKSPKITSQKTFKIQSVLVENNAIPEDPKFTKEKTFFLPLILFNSWSHVTRHQVGTSQFINDVSDYVRYTMEEGLIQAGAKRSNNKPDVILNIKVKRLKAYADYGKSGYFFFLLFVYGFGQNEFTGPFVGDVVFEIDIKDGNREFTREVTGEEILTINDFNEDIDDNQAKITRALEYAINKTLVDFIKVYPR
jgi:hypothetical protein